MLAISPGDRTVLGNCFLTSVTTWAQRLCCAHPSIAHEHCTGTGRAAGEAARAGELAVTRPCGSAAEYL
jgi:hypothetical protein